MRKSFTLIETIVVVAVIGLTLPIIFAIIFTLMREQIKISRLTQVKREGDYAINLMENTIRNKAVTIHSGKPANDTNIICAIVGTSPSASSLYFLDENKLLFGYSGESNTTIVSENPSTNLTSSKIIVDHFSIGCSSNAVYSPSSVLIDFDIRYNTTSTRPEETASMHYHTRIKLRN